MIYRRWAAALSAAFLGLTTMGCASSVPIKIDTTWTVDEGGVTRGDRSRKQLAFVFTGGEHGEGSEHILDTLQSKGVKASFFVTGDYVAVPGYDVWLRRMVREGHYLGPHSHAHLLYAPWEDRQQSLVTQEEFKRDLETNAQALRAFGALPKGEPAYFIPPFEWYNSQHVAWAKEMGYLLFNFTPGSGSHRDWIPEAHEKFETSPQLLVKILEYERTQSDGLNGHLLLLHLGGQREDKMYLQLGSLIDELRRRGYHFVRVDVMLSADAD